MSLHNLTTTITPAEHGALWNVLVYTQELMRAKREEALEKREDMSHADHYLWTECNTARLWLTAQSEQLYEEWTALPAGSHLKAAYEEEVWTWSDRDLEAMPEADTTGETPARPGA